MSIRKRAWNAVRCLSGALGLLCVVTAVAAQDPNNSKRRSVTALNHSPPISPASTPPTSIPPASTTPAGTTPVANTRWHLPQDELIASLPPYKAHSPIVANVAALLPNRPVNEASADSGSPVARSFEIHWDNSPEWTRAAPGAVSAARQFRRRGLPLVRLWQSPHLLLSLGLSNRGRPGIYLTQRLNE